MVFYFGYSIACLNNNSPFYIFVDFIIQIKPFLPFVVIMAVHPTFTPAEKKILRNLSVFNSVFTFVVLIIGWPAISVTIFHPAYACQICFLSSLIYLYCSLDEKGQPTNKVFWESFLMLAVGLLTLKAKYYAFIILAIYFFFFYKPGVMKRFNVKHAIAMVVMVGIILAATYNKIEYYFLKGNSDTFDPEMVYKFARPVLYLTGGMILVDYFPFGSGLASFASAASEMSYSNVYYEYGINNVHGISPRSEESFICDAYYPSLAQFGIVGFALFIWFWIYVYSFLRRLIRYNSERYKYEFIIGSLIICFILIESVAGTTFAQSAGLISMSLLGVICAKGSESKLMTECRSQEHSCNQSSVAIKRI